MQPSYISVMNVFTQQTRYTVPLFQRPYVWKKEDQWKPLWDDIEAAADRVLLSKGQPVASHFLGTVVLEQTPNPTYSLPRREVIDGQQRLTTLQLVLKAAEHALDDLRAIAATDEGSMKSVDIASRQIAPLTSNPAYAEEEERYKVWPTNEDRTAFCDVMDSTADQGPQNSETRMAQAYLFFRAEFAKWLAKGDFGDRATALASALKDHMRLIVLDLDATDEPQAIFETLNAHGTPLLPADLIKNWLLWEGSRQSLDVDQLYVKYWQSFDRDSDYWRAITGVGHAARARVDTFLQNWLTRHVREAIPPKHLYDRFLRFISSNETFRMDGIVEVPSLMNDIAEDAKRFRRIEAPDGKSRFDTFLRRLKILDIVVFHPLILEMMGRKGSDDADRDVVAKALESYLIRRLVCGNQTRGYGSLNLTLLDRLSELTQGEAAAPTIVKALSESGNNTDQWPDNTTFLSDWCRKKFYGNLRRNRVLMILQAIEEQYQTDNTKSEPVHNFNFGKLEIEHIMPQAWEAHWTLPETLSREDRNWALHGIGNLTLISGSLNKELSHGPWTSDSSLASKSDGLRQHSKLELNARILRDHPEIWDENTMQTRAKSLFEVAREIWPPSSDFLEN